MFSSRSKLIQGLSVYDSVAIIIGTVIGSGVFLKTGIMSQTLGAPLYVMLAWVAGAILSYAGALSYAELGCRFPKAGGEYVYLREAYGDLVGFLYGWTKFWIAGPGSIAAFGVGAATFMGGLFSVPAGGPRIGVAIVLILFFTLLNSLSVKIGGKIQTFLTSLKLLMIFGIIFGIFFFGQNVSSEYFFTAQEGATWPGWSAFGVALISALWAYDGWNNLSMVGEEIKNPQKNIPLALGLGLLAIVISYGLANWAYFSALPFEQILTANSSKNPQGLPVATLASKSFLGENGILIMSAIFTISVLGSMHGSMLSSARVPYAMAKDGFMLKILGTVHSKTHAPVMAVLSQSFIAIMLAISGTFDQLTDWVVFSSWIFYGLAAASIFIFRYKKSKQTGYASFLTPGFPWVPGLFVLVSIALLINTLVVNPKESLLGLLVILLGVPVYFVALRFKRH